MSRLKGLDEMGRTGLEIDWDAITPKHSAGRPTGRRYRRSRRTMIVSILLASAVFLIGGYGFTQGLLPGGEQIRFEMTRRAAILAEVAKNGSSGETGIRPGIEGIEPSQTGSDPEDTEFYRERMGIPFPAGRVDDSVISNPQIPTMPVMVADMTGNGLNKAVRIKDMTGDRIWLTAYMPANGEISFSLPAGGYRVVLAEGAAWYGAEEQFRDGGRYYSPQVIDVQQGQQVRIELPSAGDGPSQAQISREGF